jgi:hypothetical protein
MKSGSSGGEGGIRRRPGDGDGGDGGDGGDEEEGGELEIAEEMAEVARRKWRRSWRERRK